MILHILIDDKFADYAISQFTRVPASSRFVVISRGDAPLQLIKQRAQVTQIPYLSDAYASLLATLSSYKSIVLHGLFEPWQEEIILHAPASTKVAWVFWGGEIYGRKDLDSSFLSTSSKQLSAVKKVLTTLKKKPAVSRFECNLSIFKKIDYCLSDVNEDYQFVCQYADAKMQLLWYNYYSIEETLGSLQNCQCSGPNILLGNSATFENNHLDALRLLRSFPLADRQVFTPLSYGEPWLRQRLLKLGRCYLGSSFAPLTSFMPRDDYNNLLLSCSIGIFPHYRPQAFGNIITMLWLGARVYMSRRSIGYDYFKRIGCQLFTIEDDLHPSNPSVLSPLPTASILHNRSVLSREYSQSQMAPRIEQIIQTLNS